MAPLNKELEEIVAAQTVALEERAAELERAKTRLEQEHEEKEQILASITSILIGLSEHGKITHWNRVAERTFGLATEEALGKPLKNVEISWAWPRVAQAIAGCPLNGAPIRLDDLPYTRPDGKGGILGLTLNRFSGSPGVLILGAEISERRFLEQQLRQAQKLEAIGRLAAGIAHEINTPTQYVGDNTRFLQDAFGDFLQAVKKLGELAEAPRRGPVSPEALDEFRTAMAQADVDYLIDEIPRAIEQSLEGVERVAEIVNAMKEFSHPGAEEKQNFDLNRAIESTITVARSEWKYVAEMVTDFDPELSPVPCLPGDFNQVILNLIVNAAHAIEDAVGDGAEGKGTITVSTRERGDFAEIRIADTGIGIPEDIRQNIFDPFFTTKEVGKGTGQGLSVAHAVVVQKHGGTISVESEVGKGTIFKIRLPMVDPVKVAEEVTG